MVRAEIRRQARRSDERARLVAHLMLAAGNFPKGTRVETLTRDLLGREPGTVPGQPEATLGRRERALSPEASVAYMRQFVADRQARQGAPRA